MKAGEASKPKTLMPGFAVAIFVFHMAVSFYLFTIPSIPVKVDVPGLTQCQPNEYGGYELECMERNDKKIGTYLRNNPAPSDYRLRDGILVALGLVVGIRLSRLIGGSSRAAYIAGAAYALPVLFGIVPLAAAVVLVGSFFGTSALLALSAKRRETV